MGTCTAETDRQTGGIGRNIKKSDSMSRLFIIWKKEKKREMKMKVQKGWPYDVPTRNSTKQQVTIKVSATRATLLYSVAVNKER